MKAISVYNSGHNVVITDNKGNTLRVPWGAFRSDDGIYFSRLVGTEGTNYADDVDIPDSVFERFSALNGKHSKHVSVLENFTTADLQAEIDQRMPKRHVQTFAVWGSIERRDEDNDEYQDIGEPELLASFESQREAEEFLAGLIFEIAYDKETEQYAKVPLNEAWRETFDT